MVEVLLLKNFNTNSIDNLLLVSQIWMHSGNMYTVQFCLLNHFSWDNTMALLQHEFVDEKNINVKYEDYRKLTCKLQLITFLSFI